LEEKKDENDEEGAGDSSTDVLDQLLGQRPTIPKKRGITEVEEGSTDASEDEDESEDSASESSFEDSDEDSSGSSDGEQSE
jgi:hypothetical protein